ncbi:MAG: dTMP kinase [Candidatus Dadabacteria bacterium]|nr:MAG: dTMP kinase [Candidatus Dadabacteria bacterium]
MAGSFITLEGIEGCGKTTQARLLAEHLRARTGAEVVLTREPGGTPTAARIREILADPECELDRRAELLLFLADRAQHVETVLRPALARGAIVLCDRYCDSTTAYQGYGRGHPLEWVERLNHWASGGLVPELTLWIDCEVEAGLARAIRGSGGPGDRFEREALDFHRRVREGFAAIHRAQPSRVVRIEGNATIEEVHGAIVAVVEAHLSKRAST